MDVNMMYRFLVVLLLASAATGTTFTKCDGVNAPLELKVENCEEQPCKLHQGGKLIAKAYFEADRHVSNLKPELIAYVFGMEVEYPVAEQDACKSLLDAECPLEQGDRATYLLDIDILSSYPKIKATMKLSLKDAASGQAISCFKLDAEIV